MRQPSKAVSCARLELAQHFQCPGAKAKVMLMLAVVTLAACNRRGESEPPGQPRFTDITATAGIARSTRAYDAAVGDFDGDGLPDLYVGNHGAGAVLLQAADGQHFADRIAQSGIDPFGDQHGAAWTDYDNDGRLDLVVTLGAGRGLGEKQNRLYHNDGDGHFHDVATQAGIGDPKGRSRSVAVLDVDNDGWLDLVIANFATPPRVFRNRHDGTFEDVSDSFGIAPLFPTRLAWADVDDDGFPDLLVSGTQKGMRLLHNDGGHRFVDVTKQSGLGNEPGPVIGMSFGDYDNDGILDLYVVRGIDFPEAVLDHGGGRVTFGFFAHDQPSGFDFALQDTNSDMVDAELYEIGMPAVPAEITCGEAEHPRTHRFRCAAPEAIRQVAPTDGQKGYFLWRDPEATAGMKPRWHLRWVGAGDHHQTGILTNARDPTPVGIVTKLRGGGQLYRGLGGGRFERSTAPGLENEVNGQSVQWADVNNDGALDLYVVDSGREGAGGRNILFLNDGNGRFVRADEDAGATPSSGEARGSGAHFMDLDGDGRLDLFLTNGWGAPPFDRGPYFLLHNDSAVAHWIELRLEGVQSNRPGLGARIEIEACGRRQVRYHNGATSYFSQSIVDPHFGLGRCALIDRLRVRWPSGRLQERTGVPADQILRLREGD